MNGERIDFIADTSAIVALLRHDIKVEEQVNRKTFAITFITLAELNLGVLKIQQTGSRLERYSKCYPG